MENFGEGWNKGEEEGRRERGEERIVAERKGVIAKCIERVHCIYDYRKVH